MFTFNVPTDTWYEMIDDVEQTAFVSVTSEDGTEIRLSAVTAVEPLVGSNGSSYYQIVYSGGHASVKESYMARAAFLTSWRTS